MWSWLSPCLPLTQPLASPWYSPAPSTTPGEYQAADLTWNDVSLDFARCKEARLQCSDVICFEEGSYRAQDPGFTSMH